MAYPISRERQLGTGMERQTMRLHTLILYRGLYQNIYKIKDVIDIVEVANILNSHSATSSKQMKGSPLKIRGQVSGMNGGNRSGCCIFNLF